MRAYILFGTFEYTDDTLYGVFCSEVLAREKLHAVNTIDNECFSTSFAIREFNTETGNCIRTVLEVGNAAG